MFSFLPNTELVASIPVKRYFTRKKGIFPTGNSAMPRLPLPFVMTLELTTTRSLRRIARERTLFDQQTLILNVS